MIASVATVVLALTACSRTGLLDAHRAAHSTASGSTVSPQVTPIATRTYSLRPGVRVYASYVVRRTSSPWLVFVHGGGWVNGSGATGENLAWARHEAWQGYQVFNLDYRLTGAARWPAQREDVAFAVDWIRDHSAVFGLSLARGAIVGISAGGQLAAIEAARGLFMGAVDLAGVVDPPAALSAPHAPLRAAVMALLGCARAACPARWASTKAITYAGPRMPPLLIVHSAHDPVVQSSMSRAYATQLRAAGRPVTLRIVGGPAHDVLQVPVVVDEVDEFLKHVTR